MGNGVHGFIETVQRADDFSLPIDSQNGLTWRRQSANTFKVANFMHRVCRERIWIHLFDEFEWQFDERKHASEEFTY